MRGTYLEVSRLVRQGRHRQALALVAFAQADDYDQRSLTHCDATDPVYAQTSADIRLAYEIAVGRELPFPDPKTEDVEAYLTEWSSEITGDTYLTELDISAEFGLPPSVAWIAIRRWRAKSKRARRQAR